MLHFIADLAGVAAYIACYLYALGAEPQARDEDGPRGGHPVGFLPAIARM